MLKIIKYWYSFEYADDIHKREVLFLSCITKCVYYQTYKPSLKEDKNFISEVLKTCPLTSEYINDNLKK